MTLPLIDKLDNFEVVGLKIAEILKLETLAQMALADAAGKDQEDWKLRVFSERSNPWEQFLDKPSDTSPLVNIWYDNTNFLPGSSDTVFQQNGEAVFNIDCYGYGVSSDNPDGGHNPGDLVASLASHKALRLARNILMAADYTYLGLQKLVGKRWPSSVSVFQPPLDPKSAQKIVGARLSLMVRFSEFSPQADMSNLLEIISVAIHRAEDGEIVLNADYDFS